MAESKYIDIYTNHVKDIGRVTFHEPTVEEFRTMLLEGFGVSLEEALEIDYGKVISVVTANLLGNDGAMHECGYTLVVTEDDMGVPTMHMFMVTDSGPANLLLNGKLLA